MLKTLLYSLPNCAHRGTYDEANSLASVILKTPKTMYDGFCVMVDFLDELVILVKRYPGF